VDTNVGPGIEADWATLWQTAALFRRVAGEVASALGFVYPQATDDQVSAFLREVQRMPPDAEPAQHRTSGETHER
jgi:aminoglycoside phosphotransferase (APT) family kinase protein